MALRINFIIFLFLYAFSSFAQGSFNLMHAESDKIKFELINNLIVIPVEINGVKLSFLLDSGVSKPILFNIINLSDSLQINNVETVYLRGLGSEGQIEALKSNSNVVKIGKAINVNQDLYVVFDENISFAPRLGVPIHGIIGYSVFKDFIVEINYGSKSLILHDPQTYKYRKCRKCRTFDLTLSQSKPYIDGDVVIDSLKIPVKLLIDTGGSDALWLFENDDVGIMPAEGRYFEDYLGKGLSGSVYGKRTTIKSFSLQDFEFDDVNVAFPDSSSVHIARQYKDRSGSISGELLKRFNIIFDYGNNRLTFKKNNNFKAPFRYNKSGIVLEQHGFRLASKSNEKSVFYNETDTQGSNKVIVQSSYSYSIKPAYKIVELRRGSPAEKAGLLLGDIIIIVNNRDASDLNLQDINNYFSDDDGKLVRIKIERFGFVFDYQFRLENPF